MSDTMSPNEIDEFRARCRAFLDEHATGMNMGGDPDPRGSRRLEYGQIFQKALTEAGLAGLTYPKEFGGQGLTKEHERIWREEYGNYPNMTFEFTISHGMCLPMLAEYGTHEQKAAYLADNIYGDKVWCQMFSGPGAGSDVASLQTKAERDGDTWVINGQKVWTTLAHVSDYGVIIARTDASVPKHAGISMFIVPLDAPGVEIRPIHQIDGGKHFNEIFFTDVSIPADNLLGDLNNGWNMATAMRTRLCIHPVAASPRIPASTKGRPVRPAFQAARPSGSWRQGRSAKAGRKASPFETWSKAATTWR